MNVVEKKRKFKASEAQKEPSRFGEWRLHSMNSTKRNSLQHHPGDQKDSLWLLAGSLLKENFNTVVTKGRFLGDQIFESFAQKLNFKIRKGREKESE